MLEHILVRVRALEQRVAELESKLNMPVSASGGGGALPAPAAPPEPPEPQSTAPAPSERAKLADAAASRSAPWPVIGPASPVASPPQPPPLPRTREQEPVRKRSDLEQLVGLKVLGRVGAAALLLAAVYFGQLGWQALGPVGRTTLVYVAGLGLIAAGWLLRPRVAQYYTAVLWGGGTSLTYAAGALASLHFELVSGIPAMLLLLGSAALGQILARTLRLEAFATVALAGAYAAPVLVGSPSPTPTAFFVLLLTLHGWAAWTERSWSWTTARVLAVLATTVLACGWYSFNGRVSTASLVMHVEVLALGLAAPELFAAFAHAKVGAQRWLLAALGLSAAHCVLLIDTWQHAEWTAFGLVAGGSWLTAAAMLAPRSNSLAFPLARLGSVLVAFGALAVWYRVDWLAGNVAGQSWLRIASLGAVASALLALRRWILVGELGACLAGALAVAVVLEQGAPSASSRVQVIGACVVPGLLLWFARPCAAAVVGLLLGCVATWFGLCRQLQFGGTDSHWLPIAFAATGAVATFGAVQAGRRHERALLGAAVAVLGLLALTWVALAIAAPALGPAAPLHPFWNVRWASVVGLLSCLLAGLYTTPREEVVARTVLGAATLAVCYVGGLMELLDVIADWPAGWSDVATSLYSLAFASALLVAGFKRQRVELRWTGLIGFLVVVAKVGVHDLSTLETPLRVLATGVLGLFMLGGAYAYARRRGSGSAA